MASWTNNNSSYYINPAHLTFVENSGYGANLIQVSASSSCYISVFIPGVIGYSDADKNYRRWKVTAYNNKFPDNDRFYIYVRLEKDGTSALIVYDKVLRGVHGGEIVEKTDDKGNVTKEEVGYDEKHAYYYIHIGEASGTDGYSIREIAYDTGYLTSDMSQNDMGGLNDMWELDKHSTPWMIRAKQWLHSFTLKGFITLIGGLVFRNSKGEDKRIVDVMRTVDSGDPNEENYVPVDDTTIPTTAWVKSQSDDKYLKKYEPDETNYRIKFFDGIEAGHYVKGMVGGSGTIFDGQGYGEMNGLTLREFLEVPELRFNRIDVVSGELWNSIAFGLIEHVDTASRLAWVKLEEKERCGLHVYDICRGIFADFGDGTQWEGVDECGFLHLYGFWTSYFTPTEIVDSGEGSFCFRYELKPGTTQHPAASMKFAVYGNFLDTSRQASAYSTRTYKRYLSKVDTWVIDPDKHIYAQYGDLNGLTIGGKEMHGYGSFQSNSYFTGVQIQFTPQQKLELQGESAYSVTLSDYEGIVTIDDEGRIIGGETELLNVTTDGKNVTADGKNVVTSGYRLKTQVQAMCGSKALFYSPSVPSEGSYIISVKPVGCTAMVLNGVVVVTSVFHTERCYVDVGVNCEGKASFSQTYHITAVRDGKNPIVADIDNEMDSVACDSAGKVLFGLPVGCTVSMWAGTRKLALDSLSVKAPAGVTCSADNTTGTVRVTDITQDAERTLPIGITAYASYGGTQYRKELVFTVNKVNAGENALLYKLSPSASSIKVDDAGNMTADGVTCEVVSSDGSTIETLAALPADGSLSMEYHLDKDAPKDYTYKSEVKVGTSTRTVTFKLYSKGNLIDVETIPVISDGGSPFVADLDNEMQSVACDEKGAVVLGLPLSTGVKAYYGSKELEVESITLGAVPGVTASVSGTTVSVTRIEQGAAENIRIPITVKAQYDKDYTRTVYLIVNKLKQGNSAVVVDLVPSASSIKVDSEGLYTPSSISCKHKVTTGKDGSSIPSYIQENYSMKVAVDGDTTPDDYTYGASLSAVSARTSVTFYLYYKGTLVDQETVPVVKDGDSPVKMDLDNEMQSVACDENGKVMLGLPLSTGVKMYYGTEELTISDISVSAPTGVTASRSGNTVTVTSVTDAASEVLKINISATASYGGETYTRSGTLTVNKLKQGNSAVVVDLVPSASSIKVDSEGLYTPSSISCKHKVTTGKDGSSIPSYIQENYSMKVAVDGDTTPDDYTYGASLSAVSARTSVTFYLYYKGVLVDQETVPVVKDGEKGRDGTDGTDGSDGKDGADAEFYMIEAAVGSIGYTMTGGYSPSSFIVSEYYVKGATKMSSNRNYIHIKGIKSGIATYLTYTSRVQEYLFNAGSWASYGFDSFLFELREGSGADSRLIGSTSVSVGKQGKDGTAGVMPRYCGSYDSDVTYIYDDQYRDIVVYRGNVFQVAAQGLSNKNVAPPVTDTSNSYWELANKFSFVAMDTALIDSANIAGFAFSVEGQTDNGTPVGLLRSQAEDTSVSCSYNGVWSQDGYYRKSPLSSVNGYSIEKVTLVANDNCRVLFNLQAFTSGTSNRGILGRLDVSYGPGQESNYLTDNTMSFSGNTSQEVSVFVPKGTHTIDVVFYKSQASAYPSDYVRYMIKDSPKTASENCLVVHSNNGVWSTDGVYRKSPLSSVNGYSVEKIMLSASEDCHVLFNLAAFTSGSFNRGILGKLDVSYGAGREVMYLDNNTAEFSDSTVRTVPVFVPKGEHTIDVVFYTSLASYYPSDYVKYRVTGSPRLFFSAQSGLLACTDAYLSGSVNATAGNIGGFEIGENSLVNTDGKAYIHMESMDKRHDVSMGGMYTHAGAEFSSVGGSASYFYASGSGACCLEVVADGSAKAVLSEGHVSMFTRYSSGQMVRISGLALSTQQAASFSKVYTDDDSPAGAWVDFLVMTGNVSLPAPSNSNKGKTVFVRCNPSYTLTVPSGVDADGGSGTSFKDGKTRFFICDGIQWHEFYCGG